MGVFVLLPVRQVYTRRWGRARARQESSRVSQQRKGNWCVYYVFRTSSWQPQVHRDGNRLSIIQQVQRQVCLRFALLLC